MTGQFMRNISMIMLLFACLFVSNAQAQVVTLQCVYTLADAGLPVGQTFTIDVDFSSQTAIENGGRYPVEITDRYITLGRCSGSGLPLRRIDRKTGAIEVYYLCQGPWINPANCKRFEGKPVL
jgi:hypothetical protein